MTKIFVILTLFLFGASFAAPINTNGDVVTVSFPDSTKLVYQCQQLASGSVAVYFVTPDNVAHPVLITCGVSS